MNSISTLKDIFSKYAGAEILDPNRLTCDVDPIMDGALTDDVRNAGFIMGQAHEKGTPSEGCMVPSNYVEAEYERSADGKLRLTGNFKLGN